MTDVERRLPPLVGRIFQPYNPVTGQPCDLIEAASASPGGPLVASTELSWGDGTTCVSTCHLLLDHAFRFLEPDSPPVLWETMIFGPPVDTPAGDLEGLQARYTSQEQALYCHAEITRALTELLVYRGHVVTTREQDCPLLALQAAYREERPEIEPPLTRAPSITCPRCGRTSHHPTDIAEGYCGACHDWTTVPPPGPGTATEPSTEEYS